MTSTSEYVLLRLNGRAQEVVDRFVLYRYRISAEGKIYKDAHAQRIPVIVISERVPNEHD